MVQLIHAFSVLEMKIVDLLVYHGAILLYLHHVLWVGSCMSVPLANKINGVKELNVGKELQQEELALQMGSRLYQVRGLKASMWYEVKISYPASILASFSIELKQDKSDLEFNMKRRLLNTEKLIFKEPGRKEVYVLVTVEPAGVVAKPHVQERKTVIFNIVCDELTLGLSHKAWWIGMLAFLCIGMALIIPYFLPSYLLPRSIKDCYEPGLSKGA